MLVAFLLAAASPSPGQVPDRSARMLPSEEGSPGPPDGEHKPDARHSDLPNPVDPANPWTFQKQVDEVTVSFSVMQGRKYVQNITKEDIRVSDDRKPPTRIIAFHPQSDLPLRLGLLVDTSASVNPRFRFEQQAATRFLGNIVRHDLDLAFVMGFADHATTTQDYSDDLKKLAAGVTALHNGGGTALFDTIRSACTKLIDSHDGDRAARVLVLLSDGDDNTSKTTLAQAIEMAQNRDIVIYAINTRGEADDYSKVGLTARSDAALKEIAEQTGGRYFVRMTSATLTKAFSAIDEEMRNRYSVSYQPRDLETNGRFRRIQIVAEKPGKRFRVRARKGYYERLESIK